MTNARITKSQRLTAAVKAAAETISYREEHHRYRDVYEQGFVRVAVELAHGHWTSFERSVMTDSCPITKRHESREAANAYAKSRVAPR